MSGAAGPDLKDVTSCGFPGSTTSSSTLQNEVELGDDDVFTVRLRPLLTASVYRELGHVTSSHLRFVSLSSPAVQTATDSSSNSSQRREPLATPHFCEARRHQCILGHFYEQHWPSERHFLDQVSQSAPQLVTRPHWCTWHKESSKWAGLNRSRPLRLCRCRTRFHATSASRWTRRRSSASTRGSEPGSPATRITATPAAPGTNSAQNAATPTSTSPRASRASTATPARSP